MRTKAAATTSLSGPLALQGRRAARGLELWASADQIELEIVDDAGSPVMGAFVDRSMEVDPFGAGQNDRGYSSAAAACAAAAVIKARASPPNIVP